MTYPTTPKDQRKQEQKQIITAFGMMRPRFFISGTVNGGRPRIKEGKITNLV